MVSPDRNYWTRKPISAINRRSLLKASALGGVGIAGMTFVGCGGDDDDGGPASTGTAPGGSNTQKPSNVPAQLSVADSGLLGRLETLDPNVTTVPGNGTNHMFDPIIELGVDYRLGEGIAEKWEQPDDLTWSLTIRQGATFHNGDPITPEDVKYTIERIMDPDNKFPQSVYFAPFFDSITATGNQVVIKTKAPNAVIPNRLNLARVVPMKYVESVGADGFVKKPVGSGPYEWVSSVTGQSVELKAFQGHWRGNAVFPGLRFENVGEESTRLNLIRTRAAHLADNMPPEQLQSLESSGLKVQSNVSAQIVYFGVNANVAPFNDKRVRQALSMIADGAAIRSGIFRDKMDLIGSAAAPPSNGYVEIDAYKKNEAEARKLLTAALGSDNFSTSLLGRATGSVFQRTGETAQAFGEQLRKFGIEINVDLRAASEHSQEYLTGTYPGVHQYTCGDILGDISHCTQLLFRNRALYYKNNELIALIEKMDATLDTDERKQVQADVLQFIHDDYAWVFMYAEHHNFAMDQRLQFTERPDGYYNMMQASWA